MPRLDKDALRLDRDAFRLDRDALRLHRDALRCPVNSAHMEANMGAPGQTEAAV